MTIKVIGLDIAKNVFQAHGVDETGSASLRRRLRRSEVLDFFNKLPPALVGIEACHTAHYWAREIAALGHDVRLMPPQFVKRCVKSQKNDMADAEAICEAVQRPSMRFVPVKSAESQAALLLHRTRDLATGQYVSLCVSDNGVGMSSDDAAKAFDPFFTTKPIGLGTGLGLSMVYGFARQSGGQARIYSELGRGAMVCLYLPRHLSEAEGAETLPEGAGSVPGGSGETVLVIDDEPLVRMLVVDVLEELGYGIIEADDGPGELKVLRSDARLDLLITDVGLPGGMNGRQVADAARVLRPGLKVMFVTGYAENAVLNHGHLEHGMSVVTKPFGVEELGRRIKAVISGS